MMNVIEFIGWFGWVSLAVWAVKWFLELLPDRFCGPIRCDVHIGKGANDP